MYIENILSFAKEQIISRYKNLFYVYTFVKKICIFKVQYNKFIHDITFPKQKIFNTTFVYVYKLL